MPNNINKFEERIKALQESYRDELYEAKKKIKLLMVVVGLMIFLVIAALLPYNYLFPLKQVEPVLTVIDSNGIVQSIQPYNDPEGNMKIKANEALLKNYAWNYVNLRYSYEHFRNSDVLVNQYKRAALFTDEKIKNIFIEEINQRNPNSPFSILGEYGSIKISVDGISILPNNTMQILFKTTTKQGSRVSINSFSATGEYEWDKFEGMSVEDRWLNPFGFKFVSWSVTQNASNDAMMLGVGIPKSEAKKTEALPQISSDASAPVSELQIN